MLPFLVGAVFVFTAAEPREASSGLVAIGLLGDSAISLNTAI
jgi:hypothetical protein